ncbi:hypothetical protein C5167_042409 [Papaver somniferum]|uniref:BRX domain-containing protein n=2 Tax=Papaver somniferum TaxID=3469 RepID=A0A4Y7L5C5_PAPSO|nr:hypothetical protein C5167_042409 [Papaver somniferum]
MAEKVPQESTENCGSPTLVPNKANLSNLILPEPESNGDSAHSPVQNGLKEQTDPAEWVVQDEPGVYITLSSLPGGGKDLRRVRFSRRRFSEKQAETWWAENRAKVHERHDIRSSARSVPVPSVLPPPPPPPPPPDNGTDDNVSD